MSGSGAPIYAAKSTIRSLKNFSKGYTDIQGKVRTATSNDPWGPSGSQMNELAHATFNQQAFLEIMEILDKRMNDKGKNWRHVFKALTVLDYLLHVGSENVVRYARDNLYIVKTLKEFQFIDEDGKDQGSNVRQKAKDITALLTDEARLKEERRTRSAMHDRMSGRAPGEGRNYNATTPTYERPGAGDDDRDLQRALEESRRMARESQGDNSDDDDLKKALELSKREEQDRAKKVEKYNEFSMTEDWENDAKNKQNQQQENNNNSNNTDFFGSDFGGQMGFDNNNNNNNNGFNNNNFNDGYLQSQPTGFNNPYLQFQQQQLQEQQMQQQMLMQQQFQQQQLLQQQQQQAFLNTMNNPYQQQLMPQMTGAPSIGSNNPFSAGNIQKAAANQPFPDSFKTNVNNYNNNSNGFGGNNNGFGNSNGFGSNNNNNNNNNSNNSTAFSDLAFLMTPPAPAAAPAHSPAPVAAPITKAPNAHDEKYAHLAFALSNREDGMDTFGNTGQLRLPSHHTASAPVALGGQITGASNPFQRSNIGGMAGSQNSNNPFGANSNGFVASNPTGFGGNSNGAYSNNTLF
ncbi:hypothetical protein EC991_007667 [Linnemannia zychae]|nr:hypothetical protein EC991_007667 [Linnemannia zychae]